MKSPIVTSSLHIWNKDGKAAEPYIDMIFCFSFYPFAWIAWRKITALRLFVTALNLKHAMSAGHLSLWYGHTHTLFILMTPTCHLQSCLTCSGDAGFECFFFLSRSAEGSNLTGLVSCKAVRVSLQFSWVSVTPPKYSVMHDPAQPCHPHQEPGTFV